MRTAPDAAPERRSPCTWRRVTGSIASASRSITPKGEAANLAMGGASPVATLSGNEPALASVRPAASFTSRGNSTVIAIDSGSGVGKRTSLTSAAVSSLSNCGLIAEPEAGFRRTASAVARGTGDEKRNAIGRMGRQGASARSRSQLNSAVKGLRTRKL